MASIDAYTSAYLDNYNNYYNNLFGTSSSSSSSSVSSVGSLSSTQNVLNTQAKELIDSYNKNKSSVKTLTKESADFLDSYTVSMKKLDQSANALRNGGVDKLLYDKEGNVTEDTVKATADAVKSMVDNYNSTMKLLNDNADRGAGVTKQLARMVTDPAPEKSMAMVGVTVNKDGTLALDSEKLTEALNTDNDANRKLFSDIIGGWGGIADGVHQDAARGLDQPAQSLINNDLAEMKELQNTGNPFREMYQSMKGNAFYFNNQAAAGMLMNIFA